MAQIDLMTTMANLPKPTNLSFSYPKEWGADGLGAFGHLADGNFAGAVKSGMDTIGFGAIGEKAAKAWLSGDQSAINARNEAMFQDLPFRAVNMTWSLMSISSDMTAQIQDFIKTMKVESAPEFSDGGARFEYPNTFSIEIASATDAGIVIFKAANLALRDFSVNWTPAGFWSQHKDGYPTGVEITADFMELDLAIRNKLESGELV